MAEKMIFGEITTGPSNDLQVATSLARDMVTKYGMSDKFGPIALEGSSGKTLFGHGVEDKEYAERIGDEIDVEVSLIMERAESTAEKLLKENGKVLAILASKLIEVETIERDEYEKLLEIQGIKVRDSKKEEE